MMTAEQSTRACAFLGESLRWDDRSSFLRSVDVLDGDELVIETKRLRSKGRAYEDQ
jgi:hypothetical protein